MAIIATDEFTRASTGAGGVWTKLPAGHTWGVSSAKLYSPGHGSSVHAAVAAFTKAADAMAGMTAVGVAMDELTRWSWPRLDGEGVWRPRVETPAWLREGTLGEVEVGGGVRWPSVDVRLAAVRDDGLLLAAEEEVWEFWNKVRPGKTGPPAGRKPHQRVPGWVRARTGVSAYQWVQETLPATHRLNRTSRELDLPVPDEVLEAEAYLADGIARGRVLLNAGHGGLVSERGGEWACDSCGCVSSDKELFAELGCGG